MGKSTPDPANECFGDCSLHNQITTFGFILAYRISKITQR